MKVAASYVWPRGDLTSDAVELQDWLEDRIARGIDSSADRKAAYEAICARSEDTVEYNLARAAITGRYIQNQRLSAAYLVPEVERSALRSRELDPSYRDGEATRILGTMYVMAPASLLKHGDSELGLAMLERLVKDRPDVMANHLRVAEAYLALGDATPAAKHLCACLVGRDKLRADEQIMLDHLIEDYGDLDCGKAQSS